MNWGDISIGSNCPPDIVTAIITFIQFSQFLFLPIPQHPPPGPPVPWEDPVDDLDQQLAEPLQEPAGSGQQLLGGGGGGAVGGRGRDWTGRFYLRPGWIAHVSLQTRQAICHGCTDIICVKDFVFWCKFVF